MSSSSVNRLLNVPYLVTNKNDFISKQVQTHLHPEDVRHAMEGETV